ncbi:MAG: hypothetical protein KDG89_11120 [Geminicoccaceae bacterium]|nr:hypothetical protein [Geminicoccaceae bacterium]
MSRTRNASRRGEGDAAIVWTLFHARQAMSLRKLECLLFLMDWRAAYTYGRPFTGLGFRLGPYGPSAIGLVHDLKTMRGIALRAGEGGRSVVAAAPDVETDPLPAYTLGLAPALRFHAKHTAVELAEFCLETTPARRSGPGGASGPSGIVAFDQAAAALRDQRRRTVADLMAEADAAKGPVGRRLRGRSG